MRNRFTLLFLLMLLMGTGMNAQVIVARMQDLANAATNSEATKATPSTEWTTSVEGGAIYDFADGKYLGGIVNDAVVEALEGDQYVTIAMWVYGRTSSLQSVFGYGDSNNGLAFELNSLKLKITAKGSSGFPEYSFNATNMPEEGWYLVAYSLRGRSSTATTDTYRCMTSTTNGQYYTKNDHRFHDKAAVGEESQKFAIGSKCQGEPAESFTGKIANLTVIRSSALLDNQGVLTYLGAAPTAETESDFRYVTVNYTAGSNTFRRTVKVSGASFTVPTPDYYSNVNPSSFTNDGTTTSYNVTCTDNFPVESGKFYSMTIRKHTTTNNNTDLNNRSIYWNGSSATISTRTACETAAGMGGYWRFERVPNTENKVRVYTNAKGKSQAINFTAQQDRNLGKLQSGAGGSIVFAIKPITVSGSNDYNGAFRLTNPYFDNCNIHDVDGTLGVWVNDDSKTGAGSAIIATEVAVQPTEILSATYVDENNVNKTIPLSKQYYWDGSAEATLDAPETYAFMTDVTVTIGTDNVCKVNYRNNFPFVVSTDDAKYFQSLKVRNDNTHYVTATYNSGSFAAGTTKSRDTNISTDAVKQQVMQSGWAFVKEPGTINKFRIYNEATGNLQLYLPNENNSTAATMAETGTAFVVDLQPTEFNAFTGGFTIRVNENDTHALGDHGSGALAYWSKLGSSQLNNEGSIFRVADDDVYIEDICRQMHNDSKKWVAKLNNKSTASVTAFNTAAIALENLFLGALNAADVMPAYRKLAQSLYRAKTNLLAEAAATQIYKLRSLTNSGDLYLHVKNNDLQGVIITQPMKYLKNQMFQLVKNETSGQYAIKCIADNSMLLNSTGNNYWDIKSTTDSETHSEYTLGNVYNGNYTISKEAGKYLSPDRTCQTDSTYIIYSNITTANAWAFEPVSATDATKGEDENYKALYELYKTYLPYKNLYVAEKAGLPGYPTSYTGTAPALMMDDQLKSAATLLNDPTSLTADDVKWHTMLFPLHRDNLLADLVNYPENRYFSIKNAGLDNRGYLVYATDAPKGTETGSEEEWNYVWSTGKSYNVTNGGETTSVSVTFDASNAAHLWCFLNHTKVDGTKEHYLYNVGLKKYARPTKAVGTYDGYTWVLTDEPAPITLKIYDYLNREMAITAKSVEVASDTVVYASVNTSYTGPVISNYEPGDGSLPFTFDWGMKDFVASDTTAVAALVRTPITLRTVAKNTNPLITGLENNQTICTYSSTKAFRVPAGVTAYYAKEKDANNIVRLEAVPDGIVPANEGVILVGAVNKTEAMLDVDYRTEVTAESNIFRNTASGAKVMGENCYILAKTDAEGIGFYHATPSSTLSQGKAYLDFSSSPVRAFTLSFGDDDVTTGISNIEADGNDAASPVYDLSGRRIAEPYGRGIYIKNGKKYFVK